MAALIAALPIIKANTDLGTIVTFGMLLQSALFLLPIDYRIALAPAVALIIARIAVSSPGPSANWLMKKCRLGRWSAQIPDDDGSLPSKAGANGFTYFIVGANINHPRGILAPGVKELGDYFMGMWDQAVKEKDKWGYLSHTLCTGDAPGGGTYLFAISYWKDIDHLRDYAAKSVHAEGMKWWSHAEKTNPHLGIFHETYVVPPGHYESIYVNAVPFGMGRIGLTGKPQEAWRDGSGKAAQGESLQKAIGQKWKNMDLRMNSTLA